MLSGWPPPFCFAKAKLRGQNAKQLLTQSKITHNSQKQNPLFIYSKRKPSLIIKPSHHPFALMNAVFFVFLHHYFNLKGYIIAMLDAFEEINTKEFDKEKETYKNKVLAKKKNQVLRNWLAELSRSAELVIDLRLL